MGGKTSRRKGAVAEREIAKMMELWWGRLEPGAKFVKTPLSGGWGGPSLRAGFKASGDLMTTAKRFNYSIEVKRREGWTWERMKEGKPSPVWEWWQQSIGQAVEMEAEPLMFFRHSREPWHVMMREKLSDFLLVHQAIEVVHRWTSDQLLERAIRADAHPIVYRADDLVSLTPIRFADLGR